jgi:hypothetical protein
MLTIIPYSEPVPQFHGCVPDGAAFHRSHKVEDVAVRVELREETFKDILADVNSKMFIVRSTMYRAFPSQFVTAFLQSYAVTVQDHLHRNRRFNDPEVNPFSFHFLPSSVDDTDLPAHVSARVGRTGVSLLFNYIFAV